MKKNNKKILFKNITTYNTQNYSKFLEFHNDKYELSYNFYTIIMAILIAYCFIINIKHKNFLVGLLFFVVLALFVVLRFYLPFRRYKKTNENIKKPSTSKHVFLFYDYYLKVDNQIIYYLKLYKVFEAKDYFYLYLNKDYSLMISKSGFKIGTVEEFTNFIKKKCLFKYKKEKY